MPNADTEMIGDLLPTELPPAEPDDRLSELEQDDLRIKAGIAYYAVPIALIHLAVIYTIVSAMTGWRLPTWIDGTKIFTLLWTSGAIVGTLFWGIRRGGIPLQGKLWLRGWPARLFIIGLLVFAALHILL